MFGRAADDERLTRPAFRFARPRAATVARGVVASLLVAMAALVLAAGTPACPGMPVAARGSPVPGRGLPAPGPGLPAPGPGVRAEGAGRPPGPAPPRGTVGVPLVVAVPTAAEVLRPGDRIDVLTAPATVLAEDVLVLSVGRAGDTPGEGTALYVAAPPAVGRRLAGAAPEQRLAVTVRPP
jgi:hypothetical protein